MDTSDQNRTNIRDSITSQLLADYLKRRTREKHNGRSMNKTQYNSLDKM